VNFSILLSLRVASQVIFHVARCVKAQTAYFALIRLLSRVNAHVCDEVMFIREQATASRALEVKSKVF